jgi:hypothetical protein
MDEDAVRREIYEYLSNNLRLKLSIDHPTPGDNSHKRLTVELTLPHPFRSGQEVISSETIDLE